jgi:hypothetical protein
MFIIYLSVCPWKAFPRLAPRVDLKNPFRHKHAYSCSKLDLSMAMQQILYTRSATCQWNKMSLADYQRKYYNCGEHISISILIVSDYSPKSAINIFSNYQIYCPHHLSFSAMLCFSHSLFLCLSAILLSPHSV